MNEERKEAVFPNGIMFSKPKEGTPEWIKGKVSFKVDEAIVFLKANEDRGWVNLDLKKSKEGKLYLQLNDWKPAGQGESLAARIEREKAEGVRGADLVNEALEDVPF